METVDLKDKTDQEILNMVPSELKVVSHQKIAEKYFNDIVKAFVPVCNTIVQIEWNNIPVELAASVMCKIVKANEVTEEHIKEFCSTINKAADYGWIEHGHLAPVCSMPLAYIGKDLKKAKKFFLFYYPLSRYSTEFLKKQKSLFLNNGSIT